MSKINKNHVLLNNHYVLWIEPVGKYNQQVWASISYQEDEIDDLEDFDPDWGLSSDWHDDVASAISCCYCRILEQDPKRAQEVATLLNNQFCWTTFNKVTYWNEWLKRVDVYVDIMVTSGWGFHFGIYDDENGASIALTQPSQNIIRVESIDAAEASQWISRLRVNHHMAHSAYHALYRK